MSKTTIRSAEPLVGRFQRGSRWSLGFLWLFLVPFFLGGLLFFWAGLKTIGEGSTREGALVAGFALVFLAFPSLMLMASLRRHRRLGRAIEERQALPNQPWLWREDWRGGRIKSNDTASAAMLWIMAVMFVGLSLPAVLAIPKEWAKGNKPILVALIFPVAGAGLGVAAARATIRRRKFGVSELEVHTLPGVIGGTLSGAVTIPAKVRAAQGFKVRLACIRRTTSGSGKNRSTHERLVWEEEKTLIREFMEHEQDRTGLPVFFNIPGDQPESMEGNPAILWRLELTADVPGVDYAARFEVPVFHTVESAVGQGAAADPTAAFQEPQDAWTPPADSRIQVGLTERGETEVCFPPARNAAVLVGLIAFTAIWTTVLVVIWTRAPLLFGIVWGLFELLLLASLLQMLFHSVRVVAGKGELTVHHRFLVFGASRRLLVDDIDAIRPEMGMQSGSKVFYGLKITTRERRTVSAGSGIPHKRHAEWLARTIREAIGMGLG